MVIDFQLMRWLYAFWLTVWLIALQGQPVSVAGLRTGHFSDTQVSDKSGGSKALRPGAVVEVSLRSPLPARSGPPDADFDAGEIASLPENWTTGHAVPALTADLRIVQRLTCGQCRPRAPPA